jgi:hypothetical protein
MSVRVVYPLAKQAEVDSTPMLKALKEGGAIEESDSVSSSPFVILRKNFGSVSRASRYQEWRTP